MDTHHAHRWRILLVEDDQEDYLLTRSLLTGFQARSFELRWVTNVDAGLQAIHEDSFDVVLVDYALGTYNGLEFIRRAVAQGNPTPFILLTGHGNYQVDLEAMQVGAADYLPKDNLTAPLLERSIRYAIERKQTEGVLREARDELEARVQDRTRELRQANELLGRTNAELLAEIGERERVEALLREREARLQLFVSQLPAVLWSTDANLRLTSITGKGLAETGLQPEQLIGGEVIPFGEADKAAATSLSAHRCALKGDSVAFEAEWMGNLYQCYVEPYHSPEGQIIGCIGIALDVTERRKMQGELAEVQRRLLESVEAERLHISQELHDGPMQELYGAIFEIEALRGRPLEEVKQELSSLQGKLTRINQALRATATELRPPALATFGLEKAIRSHIMGFKESHPELEIELELDPDGQTLPERVRLALYRIYQQALANIARHAQATRVRIRFSLEPEQVLLEVWDNGRGFEVPARWVELVRQGHLGLVGAGERAEAVGGQLKVDSQPGRGTLIQAVVARGSMGAAAGELVRTNAAGE